VTGKNTVSDARGRIVAEAVTRLFGTQGAWTIDASNAFGAGPTVLRDAARVSGTARVSDALRTRLDGDFDVRRDDTFDTRREDGRGALGASLAWASADRANSARAFGRVERLRSAAGSLALFPDYDYQQVGVEYDRFGLLGHAGLVYAYATRAFPDTSSRSYREHTLSLDARTALSDPLRLETTAYAGRRIARQDTAFGDRFTSADVELALVYRTSETFEFGPRGRAWGQSYDAPTPTFFDAWIWRWSAFARFLPDAVTRFEVRPEVEFLRTPDFGGLPDDAAEEDRKAVANEEYDQLSLALEGERIDPATWWWGTLAGGHRDYLDDGKDASDLSARTSFWYVDLSGFGERKLTGTLRVRASGGLRTEFHRLDVDNVTSVDLALDLRVSL
jgi:hypothetical protein